jgi:hypothetical protein
LIGVGSGAHTAARPIGRVEIAGVIFYPLRSKQTIQRGTQLPILLQLQ